MSKAVKSTTVWIRCYVASVVAALILAVVGVGQLFDGSESVVFATLGASLLISITAIAFPFLALMSARRARQASLPVFQSPSHQKFGIAGASAALFVHVSHLSWVASWFTTWWSAK